MDSRIRRARSIMMKDMRITQPRRNRDARQMSRADTVCTLYLCAGQYIYVRENLN